MITIHVDLKIDGSTDNLTFTSSLRGDTPDEKRLLRQNHTRYAKEVETKLALFVSTLGVREESA